MCKHFLSVIILVAGFSLTSCETYPEPSAAEMAETRSNIGHEQEKAALKAQAVREKADLLDELHRKSNPPGSRYDSHEYEDEAYEAREKADQIESDRRMMGRGAAG